ncbi:MAG: RsmF rRNA methyltransferase first C-terminal domain-containing protein [Anaerobutyricum soehngenii]
MRDIPEWKQWKKRLFFIKERAFLLPEHCPDLRGLRIVRSGLYLGDCLKKRFEPSQALAMALHPSGYKEVFHSRRKIFVWKSIFVARQWIWMIANFLAGHFFV